MNAVFDATRTQLPRTRQACAGDLLSHSLKVTPETCNQDVQNTFAQNKSLISLPVVEAGRAIGLINRNIFMSHVSKPFHREVYGKKSCIAFMDKEPLQADEAMSIEELTFRAVASGEKAFADGFIITNEHGDYLGMGRGMDLMSQVADIQAEKNRQILHSIDYASVIQRAMLRQSQSVLQEAFHDAYMVWEPRDVVGGDFYHFCRYNNGWFAAIADCTGHGVPGAFMTMIASSCLTQALENYGPENPAQLLACVNGSIKSLLGQFADAATRPESDEGLDAGFIWFNSDSKTLTYAGAKTSLFYITSDEDQVQTLDGVRMGVGYIDSPEDFQWKNSELKTPDNTLFFITTDGLIDQIGDAKKIAFGKRHIRDTLHLCKQQTTKEICQSLLAQFNSWQGSEPRRDDLTFFCFRSH